MYVPFIYALFPVDIVFVNFLFFLQLHCYTIVMVFYFYFCGILIVLVSRSQESCLFSL